MGDRPVDDVLDDLRDGRGRGEASELRQPEDHDETQIRPQIREIAPQRQQTQGLTILRAFYLGARNYREAGAD